MQSEKHTSCSHSPHFGCCRLSSRKLRTYSTRKQIRDVLMKDDEAQTGAAWIHTADTSCRKTQLSEAPDFFFYLIHKSQDRTMILVVLGDVCWSVRNDDDGQHDEAEHEQKNDQVEYDQESQEGEVGQNPCSESCWNQKRWKTREVQSSEFENWTETSEGILLDLWIRFSLVSFPTDPP